MQSEQENNPWPFTQNYPRDMLGYAGKPPHPHWPGGARLAIQFVLNYEEGSENNVLHGDSGSEQFLSDIIGAASYQDRHMSMDSLYEYGSRAGFWRIHNEFQRRGLTMTIFGVAMALARNPEVVQAIKTQTMMWSAMAGAGFIIKILMNKQNASICCRQLKPWKTCLVRNHRVGIPGATAQTHDGWWLNKGVFSMTVIIMATIYLSGVK